MVFKQVEDIDVWKRGCRLAVSIYKISQDGSLAKDFGLRDQIRRAAVSIPSNVAEGFERETDKEFIRFLYISKGSCAELKTQLYIVQALEYISKTEIDRLIAECKEISPMLSGLIKYLSKSQVKSLKSKERKGN